MIYEITDLILTNQTSDWCRIPYPGHPKGCPNYNHSDKCPPNAPKFNEYFDIAKPLFLVNSEFDLASHILRMKEKHPDWSERQLKCVFYWQSKSRAQLMTKVRSVFAAYDFNRYTTCPEAMGLNVYATARIAGLHLEKIHDLKICRHIAVIGYKP